MRKLWKSDPNNFFSGFQMKVIKKYPEVVPIQIIMLSGIGLAFFYCMRLATKHPEVSWRRKTNPEPWNEYAHRQYKFLSSGRDYSVGSPAPKYK